MYPGMFMGGGGYTQDDSQENRDFQIPNFGESFLHGMEQGQAVRLNEQNKDAQDANLAQEAQLRQQQIQMNQIAMAKGQAMQDTQAAYATQDPAKIAAAKAAHPEEAQQIEDQNLLRNVTRSDLINKGLSQVLMDSSTITDWQSPANQARLKGIYGDQPIPHQGDTDPAEFSAWRQAVLSQAVKHENESDSLMNVYDRYTHAQTPQDKVFFRNLLTLQTNKLVSEGAHLDSLSEGKGPQGAPKQDDLNSAQAAITGSPYLSKLTPDIEADTKKGIPYQVNDQGRARNYIAATTTTLQRQYAKTSRGADLPFATAQRLATQEAELHTVTDKNGKTTFNPDIQTKGIGGRFYKVIGEGKDGWIGQDINGRHYKFDKNNRPIP